MAIFKNWTQFSLLKQMLIVFTSSVVISLLIVEILSLGFLVAVVLNISSTSTDVLTAQIGGTVSDSVIDAVGLFESTLNTTIQSALFPIAQVAADTFRADQPLSDEPSFYDSASGLQSAGPTTPATSQRYGGQVISLLHSTWLLGGVSSDAAPTLSTDQQTYVTNTAHADHVFRPIYDKHVSITALYYGFNNKVYRRYPGTGLVTTSGNFDPTARPWYANAQKYASASSGPSIGAARYIVTDPYRDAFGKGWTITFATVINNTASSGAEIGVAGVDLLIQEVKDQLDSFSVSSSVTSLYLTNGNAITSPSWNTKTWSSNSPFTYKDATAPAISQDLWNQISSAKPNSDPASTQYKDPNTGIDYLVVWKALSVTNGMTQGPSYVIVAAFPRSLITQPVDDIKTSMNSTLVIAVGISLGVFAAILIFVVILVIFLARAAVKPLNRLSKESQMISNNIGNADIFQGVGETSSVISSEAGDGGLRNRGGFGRIDETSELQRKFYSMVRHVRESATRPETSGQNDFYENALWANAEMPAQVAARLPNMPPGGQPARPVSTSPVPQSLASSSVTLPSAPQLPH
ncbi:hypothetical protein HK105_209350 [Polyrhizophydium stewartii]|uniref:Cache domain-containing protein n=1 Tax=Polyrhizophydium stewartii TaxID=2732419 RepID=A0ABR4MVD0_9FUNG|nr:hypothetical protein HK105_006730 [Polyrhizophydium stewartii]